MVTLKNGYNVWTRTSDQGTIPVLLLHGGPGQTSAYFEEFENILGPQGYQLIFYDQLGSGNSDRPDDNSLWRVNRFCEEVEEVRQTLGLEKMYLLGHSWGGMLAIEYALKYSQHLRGLVPMSCTASFVSQAQYRQKSNLRMLASLPADIQKQLVALDAKAEPLTLEERGFVWRNLPLGDCHCTPYPASLLRSFQQANYPISELMCGGDIKNAMLCLTSDFKDVKGELWEWDRWNVLKNITIPTLVIGATYDLADPQDAIKMAQLIPSGKSFICPEGSHFPFFDDKEAFYGALLGFLNSTQTALEEKAPLDGQ